VSHLTLTFKGNTLKSVPLQGDEITVGSDPDSDLYIDSLAVEPCHLRLMRQNHGWYLQLPVAGGVLVNQAAANNQPLCHEDRITFGKYSLTIFIDADTSHAEDERVADSPLPPRSDTTRQAWLQFLGGANVGKTLTLNRNLTHLGKPGVQVAVIARRENGYFLSHLEGEQPPIVNGQSIGNTSWPLQSGEVIQIGHIKMQFILT
jgi:predicted component of type VI protein secretion system